MECVVWSVESVGREGRMGNESQSCIKANQTDAGTHVGVGAAEMIHDLYAARRRNAKRKDLSAPAQRASTASARRGARAEKQILLELL